MGIWEGSLGCEFLRGWMRAEGIGCGRRWVRWVLQGTGTASGHPALSRTSKQTFAPFPAILRRGIGWDGLPGYHISGVVG